jgi:hypothetical protein
VPQDAAPAAGMRERVMPISTSGGSVFLGLTAYGYPMGLPIQVATHNFGSVDSIGVATYCGVLEDGLWFAPERRAAWCG